MIDVARRFVYWYRRFLSQIFSVFSFRKAERKLLRVTPKSWIRHIWLFFSVRLRIESLKSIIAVTTTIICHHRRN